ncbi:MAG TPA: hypothetical protein VKQ52_08570, partial [Puia sp.]|nr:hypothetical protein [Puia sp.]
LHSLVNKYIRDRIAKQENKAAANAAVTGDEHGDPNAPLPQDDDSLNLLFRHEQNERGMIRVLLEYGLRSWDEQTLVADYVLGESAELADLIDNKRLLSLLQLFRDWYQQGLEPTSKNFLYHEDQELSTLAVSVMDVNLELSPNWKEHYEGKIATPDDLYKEDVTSVIRYLKLRKIKRLMEENQVDMNKPIPHEEWLVLYETHKHLKDMEIALMQGLGTVIVK